MISPLGGAILLASAQPTDTAVNSALHVPALSRSRWSVTSLLREPLALAVDLVWGFGGILPLGHAAFFALGGYAMGMYLMRQIGTRGVYGNAK